MKSTNYFKSPWQWVFFEFFSHWAGLVLRFYDPPKHNDGAFFDGTNMSTCGEIVLKILIGPCKFKVSFVVVNIPTVFNLLLRRPWICRGILHLVCIRWLSSFLVTSSNLLWTRKISRCLLPLWSLLSTHQVTRPLSITRLSLFLSTTYLK